VSNSEHQRAADLLPWLVNGSLQGAELTWLNHHLGDCVQCREEQRRQLLLREVVARQPVVELAPQASFKRLWARIEAAANAPADADLAPGASPAASLRRGDWRWGRMASIAAGIAALALVGLLVWQQDAATTGNRYHTVSSAASPVLPGQIRVVFADTATIADIKSILASAHLDAAAGPTSAGVFTLQPVTDHSGADLAAVTRALRSDPRVRFAELR
jgi:hypothetical protein